MRFFYLNLGLGYFTEIKDLDKRIFPKLSVINFKSIKRFTILSMLKCSLSYRHQNPKILYVNNMIQNFRYCQNEQLTLSLPYFLPRVYFSQFVNKCIMRFNYCNVLHYFLWSLYKVRSCSHSWIMRDQISRVSRPKLDSCK